MSEDVFVSTTLSLLVSNMTTSAESSCVDCPRYNLDDIRKLYYATFGCLLTVLCVVGTSANVVNIVSLSVITRQSHLPVYRCFLGLACADLLANVFQLITSGTLYLHGGWKEAIVDETDIQPDEHFQMAVYEIGPIFAKFSHAASNWSMVGMCLFRNIGVFWPLYYQSKIASRVIFVDLAIALVYFIAVITIIPQAATYEINSHGSITTKLTEEVYDLTLTTIILVDLIPMILNIALLIPLVGRMLKSSEIQRSASNASRQSTEKRQAAITLTAITIFYIVCLSPKFAVMVIHSTASDWWKCALCWEQRIKIFVFTEIMQNVNYSGNFFFYILLNRRMREKMLKVFVTKERAQFDTNATETERVSLRGRKQPSSSLTSTSLYNGRSFPAIMESHFEDEQESPNDSATSQGNHESLPLNQTNNISPDEPNESKTLLNTNNSCNGHLPNYSTAVYSPLTQSEPQETTSRSSIYTTIAKKDDVKYDCMVALASMDTIGDLNSPRVSL